MGNGEVDKITRSGGGGGFGVGIQDRDYPQRVRRILLQRDLRYSGRAGRHGDVPPFPRATATRHSAPKGKRERMNCEETLALLDAYFDNELDLTKTLAIEEHLRDCASCRSQYELRVALRQRLQDPDLRYAIPDDFAYQVPQRLAVSSRPARRI